ncbi:MAG TPA: transposase family protein [Stellaceae bacterium]
MQIVLAAAATPVPRDASEVSSCPEPLKKPLIPAADVARIRTWRKYGMTVAQVAEMYGVAPDEVERILRRT